jgi:hypothetical protein
MSKKIITIEDKQILVKISTTGSDYISLTDMAKYVDTLEPRIVVQNWLRTRYTLDFIGSWEMLYNPNFNRIEFDAIRFHAGENSFTMSPDKWIKQTNAIGITSSSGRYGGTFAHKDIAFEFATWLSPQFKLYLIKEFQRLKAEENERLVLGWDAKRALTKINYRLHTDAIKENIVLPQKLSVQAANVVYATEADVLNKALFGMTAAEWKEKNPNQEGNMRDYADVYQLICLANLETLNSEFIKMGMTQKDRLLRLNEIAISQMQSLLSNNTAKKLLK